MSDKNIIISGRLETTLSQLVEEGIDLSYISSDISNWADANVIGNETLDALDKLLREYLPEQYHNDLEQE